MSKIAIVGTGISGLAAAHLLYNRHEITVYEKDHRIGGHSRTVMAHFPDRAIPVDTGFIVFNERNYPNLTALFRALDVPIQKSDMSFALSVRDGWLEWGAQSLDAIFGQRGNLLRPRFLKLIAEVMRFNSVAVRALDAEPSLSLGQFIDRLGLSDWFKWYYLLPMAGAIWSCPPRQMLDFPARSFVQFFVNHSLLGVSGQPQWLTVKGGSANYVERLSRPFAARVRTRCGVAEVERKADQVLVRATDGSSETYDEIVFACHADDALRMLTDPSLSERSALGAFRYQANRTILHKDVSVMPRRRRCWASWAYQSDGRKDEQAIHVSYWMNRLQSIDENCPLFVTLNPAREIAEDDIFDTCEFQHPVFGANTLSAQAAVAALQGLRNTWFCGAHLGYGFHEDGLVSAMRVADALKAPAPWRPAVAARPVLGPASGRQVPAFGARLPEHVLQS